MKVPTDLLGFFCLIVIRKPPKFSKLQTTKAAAALRNTPTSHMRVITSQYMAMLSSFNLEVVWGLL